MVQVVRHLSSCPDNAKGAVIALGNFDGVHLGHRAVLSHVHTHATRLKAPSAVMTFVPHPLHTLQPDLALQFITSFAQKARLLDETNIDVIYALRFNQAFAHLSADDFITHILVNELAAAHIVVGHDFTFGYKRAGTTSLLTALGKQHGFGVSVCDAYYTPNTDQLCSSSTIRQLLSAGELATARHMLGRPITLSGTVQHGHKRGRTIGVPTANIAVRADFPLAHGVYACRLEMSEDKGTYYAAVANIGVRPSFDDTEERLLEVHIFGFEGDLYDKHVTVELISFIREERRFAGIEALKEAIDHDIVQAKNILSESADVL